MTSPETGSIWFIHPYAGGPGVGRYDRPFHLARHWQALGRRAVIMTPSEHHLLDTPRRPGVEQIDGAIYEFIDSPTYAGNGLGRLRNMATFTLQLVLQGQALARRHGRPAMIIASSPHPYAWLAVHHLALRFKARAVFEVRDLWPLSLVELAGVSPSHPLVRATAWLERHAYRSADAVVSLLPGTLEHMRGLGLDPARWHYIPNGVDDSVPGICTDQPCTLLARKWRSQGRTVIVYAGALGRPNHVESLVQAMALQRDAGQPLAAVIVGRGELQGHLRELVAQLRLEDRVALFEQIPKHDVLGLLREASAGYISLRPEPLFRFGVSPNKLFDYMLAALPVLFAVRAGNDPVVEAGCGVSVDPGDPQAISAGIAQLAALTEEARQAMGERGRAYVVQRHGYRQLAEDYLRLLAAGAP
jgi:glycosyltransferase involved in cell wall biosynthesis